jgi:hypothetical protein
MSAGDSSLELLIVPHAALNRKPNPSVLQQAPAPIEFGWMIWYTMRARLNTAYKFTPNGLQ